VFIKKEEKRFVSERDTILRSCKDDGETYLITEKKEIVIQH
jgi:hypothetical protein